MITTTELDNFLGVNVAPSLAAAIIAGMTAEAQAHTGQTITRVDDDAVELFGVWGRVLPLPERPVVDVTSVTLDGVELVAGEGYELRRHDLHRLSFDVRAASSSSWLGPDKLVAVVYSHGWTVDDVTGTMPTPIRTIAKQAAARAVARVGDCGSVADLFGERAAPIVQETIGAYSATYATGGRDDALLAGDLLNAGELRRIARLVGASKTKARQLR